MNRRRARLVTISVFLLVLAGRHRGTEAETGLVDKPSLPGRLAPELHRGPIPRAVRLEADPRRLAPDVMDARAAGDMTVSKIIFVNRCPGGCTIRAGNDDARANTSTIPAAGTSVLNEFPYDDATFNAVIECVREVYAPYDVEVVTEDPGDVFHHEVMLAGNVSQLGLAGDPQAIGGIAIGFCEPLNNVISFAFPESNFSSAEAMCWVVAQESAHSFGLPDHVRDCHDPMTYIPGCERKFFRNKSYTCGDFADNVPPCRCTGTTRNSHIELLAVFGDGVTPPPPEVEMLLPAEGGTLTDNFGVFVDATDRRLIDRLELYLNGYMVAEKTVAHASDASITDPRHSFTAPDWPDGYVTVEVRAYNDLGGEGVASVRALKGAPCEDASTCFVGQECQDGGCAYPAPTQDLGDRCEIAQECVAGTCVQNGGDKRCAESCDPTVSSSCPVDFECLSGGVCWPTSTGGCCSVASKPGAGIPWLSSAVFLLAWLSLRRRATRGSRPQT